MIHPTNKGANQPEEASSSAATKAAAAAAATATPAGSAPTTTTSRRRKKPKQQTPPTKDMTPLHPHFQPGKLDVICSRGKFAYNSPGNCWFRMMVEEQMDNYANARTKTDKSLVVSILVNRVRHANPNGGFVKNFGGRWYRVSDRYSREKVGQQFRDLLHTKYRSSTKAKAEKRKRQQNGEEEPPADLNNSNSSIDEERSSKSTRERLQHTSPRHHSSPGSTTSITMADPTSEDDDSEAIATFAKMPPLDFEARTAKAAQASSKTTTLQLQPDFHSLQPRYNKTSAAAAARAVSSMGMKRAPDMGEEQPGSEMPPLDEGNMDLDYLDDFEPLPMLNATNNNSSASSGATASRNNSLNLMSGLQDSFPNIFNPPDLHQSLPTGNLEFYKPQQHGRSDRPQQQQQRRQQQQRQPQDPDDPSDPYYQPWHMSI